MREFLLATAPVGIWLVTIAEMIILVFLFKTYQQNKKIISLCMTLVCAGLVYDAFVIAIGAWIPESLMSGLSHLRFISHGVLVPLNLLTVTHALKWDGIKIKIMYLMRLLLVYIKSFLLLKLILIIKGKKEYLGLIYII